MQYIRHNNRTNPLSDKARAHTDWVLIILVYIISIFGVFAVSVATFTTSQDATTDIFNQIVTSHYGLRQAIFVLVSPIILGLALALPFDLLYRNTRKLYWASLILLGVASLSDAISGVSAWINIIWGFTIQPAEFAKLAIIIMLAKQLETIEDPLTSFKNSIRFFAIVGTPVAITVLQGEMGSAVVMVAIVAMMLYFAGMSGKKFISLIILGILMIFGIILFWLLFKPDSYRLERILAAFNPDAVSNDSTYQVNNSKIAIGSGGLYGIGVFVPGSISQLDFVPKDWTDFIFSTIGEAFGFIGSVSVIILFALIIFRLLYLAKYTQNRYGELAIIGVATMFFVHVVINIAMTMGLVPVVGIPLPFLSYGGSNMFTNMLGIGLALNITKNRRLTKVRFNTSNVKKIL